MKNENIIYQIRRRLMVSRKELAELIGVSNVAIHHWETGKFQPNYVYLRRLDQILKKAGITDINIVEARING